MKTKSWMLSFILVTCASGQVIRIGQSTVLNGISNGFGIYGQLETTYQGVLGQYAFWKQEGQPIHILPLLSGSLSGIDTHCMAGTYANSSNFNIAGFQQCTDNSGHVQFFSFEMGANATVIMSQLPGSEAVAGFFDNFHLQDTGFVATPVFDSNGKVLKYNTQNFTVPGAISTNLPVANQYGIGGSFETDANNWVGFLQRSNHPLETVTFPGATTVGITAISADCLAGYFSLAQGNQQGFFRCGGEPIPLNMGYGGTSITEIVDDSLVGHAEDFQGNSFGFIWQGLTSTLHR